MDIKNITKEEAVNGIKSLFELLHFDKKENGKSFYGVGNFGNATFYFDKRQYMRDEVIGKLVEYFRDKNIVGGQCRISPITLLYTVVSIEDRA